jgi:carbon monoxide dehydrogenase subunit G
MRLSFSGSLEVSAPLAVVWQRLTDPQFVAAAAPGVEKVEQVDASHFTVFSAVGLGAIRLPFTLEVELLEVIVLQRMTMRAQGSAPGAGVDLTKAIHLVEAAAGRTTMTWQSDCAVSGLLAGLGVHFLEGTARKHTEKFWLDFATRCARAD